MTKRGWHGRAALATTIMSDFKERLRRVLKNYTPAHASATDRIPAAVVVPLFEHEDEPYLLFTKRTASLQYHSGEICFPGGAYETDDGDMRNTALRELYEELAIAPKQVEIVGRLDDMRTASSYFIVVPYVAILTLPYSIRPNELEVQEVLEIPLSHFRDPSIFAEEQRLVDGQLRSIYHYQWQNHTIWGLTARILKRLLDLLDSSELEGVKND